MDQGAGLPMTCPSDGCDGALYYTRRRMYESGNDDGTFGQRPAGKVC